MDAIIAMAVGTVPAERTTLKVWTRFGERIMEAIQELRDSQQPILPEPSMIPTPMQDGDGEFDTSSAHDAVTAESIPDITMRDGDDDELDTSSAHDAIATASIPDITMLSAKLSSALVSDRSSPLASSHDEANTPTSLTAPANPHPTSTTSAHPVPATSRSSTASPAPTAVRVTSRATSRATSRIPVTPPAVSLGPNLSPNSTPHAYATPIQKACSPSTPHLAPSRSPTRSDEPSRDLSPALGEKVGSSRRASAEPSRPACSPSTTPTDDAAHIPQHDAAGVKNPTRHRELFEGDLSDMDVSDLDPSGTDRGREQGCHLVNDASSQQVSTQVAGKSARQGKVSQKGGSAKPSPVKRTVKGKRKVNRMFWTPFALFDILTPFSCSGRRC